MTTVFTDINGVAVTDRCVIDIYQTVNGQNEFIVMSVNPLDVRYASDPARVYQYRMEELFEPSRFTGEVEYEIIGHYTGDVK